MAPDGAGGAFFIWWDWPSYQIFAQHVLGSGAIAPGWPTDGLFLGQGTPQMGYPSLIADGAGGMYGFWDDASTVFAQHLAADGTRVPGWPEQGLVVRQSPGTSAGGPIAAPDGQGGCFVVWGDGRFGTPQIFMLRIAWGGELAEGWPINGIAIATGRFTGARGIVPDGTGGVYVGLYRFTEPKVLDDDIWATRVLGDGSIAPGWPPNGLPVALYPGYQALTDVSADSTGGLLLAWSDARTYPPRIFVQRLRPDGTPAPGWQIGGTPISDVLGYQDVPGLAPDGNGGAFVVFEEAFNNRGYVQRVTAGGTRPNGWPSTGVQVVDPAMATYTSQRDLSITPDGSGGAIAVWDDTREYGLQSQIYAQRYTGDDITAALTSLVRFEALPERVKLLWSRGSDAPNDVRIERQRDGEAWSVLGSASFTTAGTLEYADHSVEPGARYGYRLAWSEAGGERQTPETRVDVPLAIALALEGLRPNPSVGELLVAFSLPAAGSTELEVLDLAGRRVRSHDASGLGTGRHVVRMDGGRRLEPGVYWVRLTHDERTLTARGMVLR